MNGLTAWMEKYILPIATKIGSQKHLIALRDAFIGTLPATMAGAIATMINAIIRDLPVAFNPSYDGTKIPVIREIIGVNGYVWNGTLAIAGLIFAFTWGYNLAKAYHVNDLAGGIVSLAAFIQGIAFSYAGGAQVKLTQDAIDAINETSAASGITATGEGLSVAGWGWLKLGHLDANAYFTVMIVGAVATIIYAKLMQKDLVIKMPDSVPPAVAKAFAAIIPATVALYVVGIFNFIISKIGDGNLFIDLIQKYIAEPFLGASQGIGWILLITLFVQIFWFFGIHGPNVLAPVLEGVWQVALINNSNIGEKGYKGLQGAAAVKEAIVDGKAYMWVRGSFDAFAWFGGAGGTITLIIAILLFAKRADYKTVGKLALGPGIFNINEPLMFGLPIVLNAMLFIPFVLAPLVSVAIAYGATYMGWVNPVYQQVPWVVPPMLMSFLATGADWRAPILTLVNMIISFFIWAPFVIAANKMEVKE